MISVLCIHLFISFIHSIHSYIHSVVCLATIHRLFQNEFYTVLSCFLFQLAVSCLIQQLHTPSSSSSCHFYPSLYKVGQKQVYSVLYIVYIYIYSVCVCVCVCIYIQYTLYCVPTFGPLYIFLSITCFSWQFLRTVSPTHLYISFNNEFQPAVSTHI